MWEVYGKITENVHCTLSSSKKCFSKKNEKNIISFSYKIKYTFIFYAFTIKNDFRNMSRQTPDFTQVWPACISCY